MIQNYSYPNSILYTFRTRQVEKADVFEFTKMFNPFTLTNTQTAQLFGKMILDFEGVERGLIPARPKMRALLRRLHAAWPWSGYFLNLNESIGCDSIINRRPLLAIALSLSDLKYATTDTSQNHWLRIGPQFSQYHQLCHDIVDRLGRRSQLSEAVIADRHESIRRQFRCLTNNH